MGDPFINQILLIKQLYYCLGTSLTEENGVLTWIRDYFIPTCMTVVDTSVELTKYLNIMSVSLGVL